MVYLFIYYNVGYTRIFHRFVIGVIVVLSQVTTHDQPDKALGILIKAVFWSID